MKKEYVYIIINPAFRGDIVKIGKTERTPEERADELFKKNTGLPSKYYVAYEEQVENCHFIEQQVHYKLRKHRWSHDREFFAVSLKDAIRVLQATIKEYEGQTKIEESPSFNNDPHAWWSSLPLIWQQIIRNNLSHNYDPSPEELIECISSIIFYCQNERLRSSVCDFIRKKNYQKFVDKWF